MPIAATDPESVIAIFKESRIRGRLRFLIEAESLFNDGTAAAAFTIAIAFVSVRDKTSILTAGCGSVCGAAVAAAILLLAGRTTDHLVETILTSVGAYGSFLVAEHFQFSGIVATLTAGLLVGNVGPLGAVSEKGKETINSFWKYTAFVAHSLIFLLIGMNGTKENILLIWRTALAAILLVMVGRAAAVYLTLFPFAHSSLKVNIRQQHVPVWGGLRGALPLALVLGLPTTVPRKEEMITVTLRSSPYPSLFRG